MKVFGLYAMFVVCSVAAIVVAASGFSGAAMAVLITGLTGAILILLRHRRVVSGGVRSILKEEKGAE
ncbi:MAG: hypothetical protein AAGK74_00295 [Chloroflexota bacterium]